MPATPARIALSLNDGVLLSKADATIKANHPNAVEQDNEIESFFDSEADAQVLLDERWAWRSAAGRFREAIEIDSDLGLGTIIPVTPALPTILIYDEARGIGDTLGPELNPGDPNFGAAAGYALLGAASVAGGAGTIPKSNAGANQITVALSAGRLGKRYRASFDITANTIVDGAFRWAAGQPGNSSQDGMIAIAGGTGAYGLEWTVSHSAAPTFSFYTVDGTNAGSVSIDNLHINEVIRPAGLVRAYAVDYNSDRYAIELAA